MHVTLINPAVSMGTRLIRSYSGGYGDIVPRDDEGRIIFPPMELVRMATRLRELGHEAIVLDRQIDPGRPLPRMSHCVISVLSLPTIYEDCASAAGARDALSAPRLIIYTSIRDQRLLALIRSLTRADAIIGPGEIGSIQRHCVPSGEPADQSGIGIGYVPPDRSLIDHTPYRFMPLAKSGANPTGITTVNASFGCPYPCGYYCPYPAVEGNKFKPIAIETLMAEFRQIHDLNIQGVVFRDPVFSLDMPRVARFCAELLRRELTLPWWCETRLDRIDDELLTTMAAAGCVGIEIGVESGDAESQRRLTRKHLSLARLREVLPTARSVGIHLELLFIIGLPGETRRNIAETFRFIVDLGLTPDQFNLSTITAYPGTALFDDAEREGWITWELDQMTGYAASTRTEHLTCSDIVQAQEFAKTLRVLASRNDAQAVRSWSADLDRWAALGD